MDEAESTTSTPLPQQWSHLTQHQQSKRKNVACRIFITTQNTEDETHIHISFMTYASLHCLITYQASKKENPSWLSINKRCEQRRPEDSHSSDVKSHEFKKLWHCQFKKHFKASFYLLTISEHDQCTYTQRHTFADYTTTSKIYTKPLIPPAESKYFKTCLIYVCMHIESPLSPPLKKEHLAPRKCQPHTKLTSCSQP